MKRFLIASAVLLSLAAGGGYAYKAAADTPVTPAGSPGACTPGHPPGPWAAGWGRGPGPGFPGPNGGPGFGPAFPPGGGGWMRHRDDRFSLFARVQNKNLSPADVKIIATAILLEHGNHDWTVADVAAQADKSIHFSFATAHGDVIATFGIDPASGHMTRIN
jgi:hypothetical protein